MRGLMMDYPLTLAALLGHTERAHRQREIVSRRADRTLERSTYGDCLVDNSGLSSDFTELPSLGTGKVVSVSGTTLTLDRTDMPVYFGGHWIRITSPTGTVRGTWRIDTATPTTVKLLPNGAETIDAQPGDGWRGVYSFDKFTIRGSHVRTLDDVRGTVVKENGGLLTINDPPVVNASLISTQSKPAGDFVIGSAGAVGSDPHSPFYVVATNKQTGFLCHCASCHLPYPEEMGGCPNCGSKQVE